MSYFKRLLYVEVAGQVALCSCAVLFSAVFLAVSLSVGVGSGSDTSNSALVVLGAGGMIALGAYLYSVGPVVLVIAPIYALLEARGRCSFFTAVATGMVPGVVALACSMTPYSERGLSIALSGACMATGASIGVGVYLVRTWHTEKASAAQQRVRAVREPSSRARRERGTPSSTSGAQPRSPRGRSTRALGGSCDAAFPVHVPRCRPYQRYDRPTS